MSSGTFYERTPLELTKVVTSKNGLNIQTVLYIFIHSQYYGHRDKLKSIGREDDLERLNKQALRLAREVADETGTLMAGNLCNSTIYSPSDEESHKRAKDMFVVSLCDKKWLAHLQNLNPKMCLVFKL